MSFNFLHLFPTQIKAIEVQTRPHAFKLNFCVSIDESYMIELSEQCYLMRHGTPHTMCNPYFVFIVLGKRNPVTYIV